MTHKTKLVIAVAAVAVIGVIFWMNRGPQPEYGNASVVFKKTGDIVQAYTPANDTASTVGLSNRAILPEDYGMLWQFAKPQKPSFTMKGMRFSLDFLWINNGKIVEVTANVPTSATTIVPAEDVTAVLEVNAGYAVNHTLKAGDEAAITSDAWSGTP